MTTVEVTSEPLTYREDSPRSFFRDLIDAERGSAAAAERLERHALEVNEQLEARTYAIPEGVEFRVNPNRTSGQGGSFAPPLWLIDRFAGVPRPGRVLADLLPQFTLPAGVSSVNVPRLTAGTAVNPESDLGGVADQDIADAQVSSPVVTIAGQGDVSLQLLDQSPPGAHMDWAIFRDLEEAYNANLELQLINGTGVGQLLGLLNIPPASNQITTTQTTATALFSDIGKTIAAMGVNRKRPPERWLMTTPRQAWIATSEDAQSRPLMLAGMDGAGEFQLAQYPVSLDDAIPRTLGAASNQDALILCRPSDGLLLESEPRTLVDFNSLSGTLQARLQLHRYVAALNGRYPTGVATLTGTGLVVPSGF